MVNFKKHSKEIILLLIAILAFSILSLPLSAIDYDGFWNFHFIQKTYAGFIPYNDFNIIIPPLFHWIGAFLMNLIGNKFILMSIYCGITIGILFYLISKIINLNLKKLTHRVIALMLITCFLIQFCGNANYNILMVIFMMAVLYIEQKNNNNITLKHRVIERSITWFACAFQAYYWICIFICILSLPDYLK